MATKKPNAPKKSPTVTLTGTLPKLSLNMPLDAKKVKAIQKCIEKGSLTITVSKVDLAAGRIGAAWIYD
jgi:anti-sigma28 factor (negative regulator of flagellin synthesis)